MGKDLTGKDLGRGISQRKDGRYCVRIIYRDEKIELYNPNLKELKKKLVAAKNNIDNGKNVRAYTVSEWFEEWFSLYKVPIIKAQSAAPMKRMVRNTFLSLIGDILLTEVRSKDIQFAVNQLLEANKYAKGSIAESLNRLRECFASAVNNKLMDINPAFDVVVPFSEERIKDRRWLRVNEIPRLLNAAKNGWWYEMLYVMIYTGLRIGEVGGLKVSDIHWSENGRNGYIEVNRSLTAQYENGVKTLRFGTLKTVNSHRRIPFLKDVEQQLKNQINKVEKLKKSLGSRYRGEGEFYDCVFVTNMGSPCTRYNAEHTLKQIVKDINLQESMKAARDNREPELMENVYPHALRHTFASLCYKAKIDEKIAQSLMGHANYSTTINIYTHFSEEDMEYDLSKFNSLNIIEDVLTNKATEEVAEAINLACKDDSATV